MVPSFGRNHSSTRQSSKDLTGRISAGPRGNPGSKQGAVRNAFGGRSCHGHRTLHAQPLRCRINININEENEMARNQSDAPLKTGGEINDSTVYTALVTREGRWWMVSVPGVGVTQARRVGEVEAMARSLVAITNGAPEDTVCLNIHISNVAGIDVEAELAAIATERAQAARLEKEATERATLLAKALADAEVPLRDVGAIFGVSHQRAHQMVTA